MEMVNIYTREDQPKFLYYHIDTEQNEIYTGEHNCLDDGSVSLLTKTVNSYLLVSVHKNTGLSVGSFHVSEEEFKEYTLLDMVTY